jgi:hypothetical protein
VADGEGHGQNRQAESERDAEQADADIRKCGGEYGTAAAAENEPKGARNSALVCFTSLLFGIEKRLWGAASRAPNSCWSLRAVLDARRD